MSNVAGLENCRELYELSGWRGYITSGFYDEKGRHVDVLIGKPKPTLVPAYSLDFLLRKLSTYGWCAVTAGEKKYGYKPGDADSKATFIDSRNRVYEVDADTPEDAICRLAIELFKQGILTKSSA